MPGQTQSLGNQQTRIQEAVQTGSPTRKSDMAQRIQHDALLRKQPGEVREWSQEDESEELDLLEEPIEIEDADMDDLDSDEDDPESIEQERENIDAIDLVLDQGSNYGQDVEPVLALGEIYALNVRQRGGQWVCSFDPPIWMRNAKLWDNKNVDLSPLTTLLGGLANWFTRKKQPFLQAPCIKTLFQDEFDRTGDTLRPIVMQNQLVKALNEDGMNVSNQDFSRIKDKIWLVWECGCMPIESLFGRQMQLDWAVAGCLHHVPDKLKWNKFQRVPKREIRWAKPLSEWSTDQLMLLHVLAEKANKTAPETVFSAVQEALSKVGEK